MLSPRANMMPASKHDACGQRDSFEQSEPPQVTYQRRHAVPTQAPACKLGGMKFEPKVLIFTSGPMRAVSRKSKA